MKVGLFFGSFNPIHIGHLIIANSICEQAHLDEVWLVVSPQNPFKETKDLAPTTIRLQWVTKAVADNPRLKACDIELKLPSPSYTFQTLEGLKELPHQFHLIMGSDTFLYLPKWKNAPDFIYDYPIEIYTRPHFENANLDAFPKARLHALPLLDISATNIRNKIKQQKSVRYLVLETIREEIEEYYVR